MAFLFAEHAPDISEGKHGYILEHQNSLLPHQGARWEHDRGTPLSDWSERIRSHLYPSCHSEILNNYNIRMKQQKEKIQGMTLSDQPDSVHLHRKEPLRKLDSDAGIQKAYRVNSGGGGGGASSSSSKHLKKAMVRERASSSSVKSGKVEC